MFRRSIWALAIVQALESRASPFVLIALGNCLYIISEIILKLYHPEVGLLDISLVRFACGLWLLYFVQWRRFFDFNTLAFASANILNSIVGYGAILYGSYQGFAIASQFRPLFVALGSVLLFRDSLSRKNGVAMLACLLLALFIAGVDKTVFSPWTILFLLTVLVQSISFSAVGNTKRATSTVEYISFYNLFGFLVVGALGLFTHSLSLSKISDFFWVLLTSGLAGLGGSILIVAGLQASQKAKNIIGTFVRFPLSLVLAITLLGEPLVPATLTAAAVMMAVLFWASKSGASVLPGENSGAK